MPRAAAAGMDCLNMTHTCLAQSNTTSGWENRQRERDGGTWLKRPCKNYIISNVLDDTRATLVDGVVNHGLTVTSVLLQN